jgi:hypothetical protein
MEALLTMGAQLARARQWASSAFLRPAEATVYRRAADGTATGGVLLGQGKATPPKD